MREKIKEFIEAWLDLPDPMRMFISAALFITLGFGIYSGLGSYFQNRKIERLEKENNQLSVQTQEAYEKQHKAEANAANEAIRAKALEDRLDSFELQEKQIDENIQNSKSHSTNLRNDLLRVRTSQPANSGTIELERKICERYGNCK